ncbi:MULTISPECIES: phytoene desaturase family protein [Brevibacterium]|uniref:Phytoene desaturase n=1 Tax=Brevibacterium casei TaxID=33889 RepID=A0A7T4A1A6_9MICO|nr:phytoene desaturase family protein [Brevibacterium casei]QQB15479.1 phytoene desaturase [Brevibacterium casei]
MSRVSVIGAGVAGLATACLLARDGHQVTVLEKNAEVGGRVGRIERSGFRFDTGPSWYLMPEVFDHFFALMGTSASAELDLTLLDPAYTVFTDPSATSGSDPVTIPAGRERVLDVLESLETGARQRLEAYLASAADAKTMAERFFLYNPFTAPSSVLERSVLIALPRLVRLLTESLAHRAEATVVHPRIRQILQYPAIFLGTDPRAAPAIYHLMSTLDLDEGVQYPKGGFRTIIDALERLARASGVDIRTSATVESIDTDAAGDDSTRRRARPTVTGLTWTDAAGKRRSDDADIVVSAADLHHTETALLAADERTYPEPWWDTVTSGPGAVLVLLGVDGQLPELAHHSLFFTPDWEVNFDDIFGSRPRLPHPASLYVCRPSATDVTVAPDGQENLFVLVPVPADPGLGEGGPEGTGDPLIERTADRAIDQIARWAGIPDLRERIVVRHTIGPTDFAADYNSWLGGMLGPAHTLRQSAMFRPQNRSRTVDGLYYAGGTTAPGVGVPMCLISAEVVLKHIRGDQTPGPLPEE